MRKIIIQQHMGKPPQHLHNQHNKELTSDCIIEKQNLYTIMIECGVMAFITLAHVVFSVFIALNSFHLFFTTSTKCGSNIDTTIPAIVYASVAGVVSLASFLFIIIIFNTVFLRIRSILSWDISDEDDLFSSYWLRFRISSICFFMLQSVLVGYSLYQLSTVCCCCCLYLLI
jgi:hypothetical protein